MILALYLGLSCVGKQVTIVPVVQEQLLSNCHSVAPVYQAKLSEALGKWPSEIVSEISSVNVVLDQQGPGAMARYFQDGSRLQFNHNIDYSIDATISSLHHEMGHHVFTRLTDRVTEIGLEGKMQEELFTGYTVQDFISLKQSIRDFPGADCIESYIKGPYVLHPLVQKMATESYLVKELVEVVKRFENLLTDEDVGVMDSYVKSFETASRIDFNNDVEMLKVDLDVDLVCDIETALFIENTYQESVTNYTYLNGEREKVLLIAKKVFDKLDPMDMGYLYLESELGAAENYRTQVYDEILDDELLARISSSLMNLFFGESTPRRTELSEEVLQQLEKVVVGQAKPYSQAVQRYREVRKINSRRVLPRNGEIKVLEGLEPNLEVQVQCFETQNDLLASFESSK
jgi:hypothetical protein